MEIYRDIINELRKITGIEIPLLAAKIQVKIISKSDLKFLTSFDFSDFPQVERPVFDLYNSLPIVLSETALVNGPAYSIENVQNEPKLSIARPTFGAPLLIFEPDRIIHLHYSFRGSFAIIFWADGFGELAIFKVWEGGSHLELCKFVLQETMSIFPTYGFSIRLAICNTNGWNSSTLQGK